MNALFVHIKKKLGETHWMGKGSVRITFYSSWDRQVEDLHEYIKVISEGDISGK